MNTRSVSICAGRRLGMMLILAVAAQAAEVTITITGTLESGYDRFSFFHGVKDKNGWNMRGEPFTLVFTFDDAKGTASPTISRCASWMSGRDGMGDQSPGKAVLTINGVSYTFGEGPAFRKSGVWREVTGPCSPGSMSIFVSAENQIMSFAPKVSVRLVPLPGKKSPWQSGDWRSPLESTEVTNQSSSFSINRNGIAADGDFTVKKVVVAAH